MGADIRDLLLLEAEATLAQVHGFRLIPYLVQAEGCFREIAPSLFPGCDVDQEWDLLYHRQEHRPAGVTRLLEVIVDECAFDLRFKGPGVLADQLRHLLALADSPHATVRVIPGDAPLWEKRVNNFDILSFAGTDDRIGVAYSILGAHLASGAALYEAWTHVEGIAADPTQSKAILERRLTALD
jgi:hypothetical protein